MKRSIALLFCLLMITMPLTGCFGEEDTSEDSSTSNNESMEATTIVNNYYNYTIYQQNNSTTLENNNQQPSEPVEIDNYYTYTNYTYANYTSNNHTNTSSNAVPELIAIGGTAPPLDGRSESAKDAVWVINSSAGTIIKIIEAYPVKSLHETSSGSGSDYPGMVIQSWCNSHSIFYQTTVAYPHEAFGGGVLLQPTFYLPSSFAFCQHTIYIYATFEGWSLVYSVENVTIG